MSLTYDVVLLDADDTLFDFFKAETYALEVTLAAFGYDAPVGSYMEAFRRINAQVWHEYETGQATSQEIRVKRFRMLLAEIGHRVEPDEVSAYYVDRLSESSFLIEGARGLIETLYRRVPLGLVTNGIGAVQRSRLARSGLGDFFDAIVISDEAGVQKPDPAVFSLALSEIGSTPQNRVIMIGDGLQSDIRGAINAGIDSCWFNLRGKPGDPDITPTYTVSTLAEVYPILGLTDV